LDYQSGSAGIFPRVAHFFPPPIFSERSPHNFFQHPGDTQKIGKSKTLQHKKVGKLLDHPRPDFSERSPSRLFSAITHGATENRADFLQHGSHKKTDEWAV
jgi:hypothetical protein